uniref:Single domain-containing protein n=1 Tax=Amphora coffeiformis TaxID=265554 RepID=A0A7S3L9G0_9STRA|mmetsp:Transcript_23505/g.44701  ORF Transcript_23505/g.44701 Transcript_23505/m.44701 type:complete len:196 (+) Transcript_23505:124-711(+)|eukprot:scaffold4396_cov204-Amphora_coffeaeformis.AAC.3
MKLSAATWIFVFGVAHAKGSSSKGKGSKESSCFTNPVWEDVVFNLQAGNVIPMPAAENSMRRRALGGDHEQEEQNHSLGKRRAMRGNTALERMPFEQEQNQDERHLACAEFAFAFSAAPNQDACLIAGGYPIYADGTFLACPTSCSVVDMDVVAKFCKPAFCNMVVECEGDPAIVVGNFDDPKAYCCPTSIAVPP